MQPAILGPAHIPVDSYVVAFVQHRTQGIAVIWWHVDYRTIVEQHSTHFTRTIDQQVFYCAFRFHDALRFNLHSSVNRTKVWESDEAKVSGRDTKILRIERAKQASGQGASIQVEVRFF